MPVKTSRARLKKDDEQMSSMQPITPLHESGCCSDDSCETKESDSSVFGRKILWTLVGILLVYGIFFLGTLIRNNLQEHRYIGYAEKQERTITVEAQGKVIVTPDLAMTTMGVTSDAPTVAEAQEKNTGIMNQLTAAVKELGVASEDIQTINYTIYPKYDYTEAGQVLLGYEVSQQVRVKIRNLETANEILGIAGKVGANNVGGLEFTIDDKEVYLAEAREKALMALQEKAKTLSKKLGVRIMSLVAYDEYESGTQGPYPMYRETSFDTTAEAVANPALEAGSNEVVMTVRAVLEIR